LPHQTVAKAQSLIELIQGTDLHLIPSSAVAFLDSIMSVLYDLKAETSFINSLVVLITKEVFRQCKVSEPSSIMSFYWHPNFYPAADTTYISRQAEWAKFTQENQDSPNVAPKRCVRTIPLMNGWNASYVSMALDKDATRIEHYQTLLESLEGDEDPRNTAIWRLLTTQSGCNFFNSDNIFVEYIKTE
ncbi:MAG: hypothetical protein GY861_00765, partial [bacterium]|nr:hypothetical protein [bacterium]